MTSSPDYKLLAGSFLNKPEQVKNKVDSRNPKDGPHKVALRTPEQAKDRRARKSDRYRYSSNLRFVRDNEKDHKRRRTTSTYSR